MAGLSIDSKSIYVSIKSCAREAIVHTLSNIATDMTEFVSYLFIF